MPNTGSLFVLGQEQTLTAHAKSLRKHTEQRLMGYPFLDSRLRVNDTRGWRVSLCSTPLTMVTSGRAEGRSPSALLIIPPLRKGDTGGLARGMRQRWAKATSHLDFAATTERGPPRFLIDSRLHGNDALVLTLAAIPVFIFRDGEILEPQAIHINCSTRCPSVILISAASF